jgi:hypothetical protein
MAGEVCMLEDGYFVCVKKAGLKQTEILTALLADGACFEGDVGKLSCLHGATMPIEIPASPAFIAKDGDDFVITPGAWMPFCPVLYGAEGLLPNQRELLVMGGLDRSSPILSTDAIVQCAKEAHSVISRTKGKRWSHTSGVLPVSGLSDVDVNALFDIFPNHVPERERHEYVIYMINTIHGAASAALDEIMFSPNTKRSLTLSLMETVTPHCQNVKQDALQAVFVPYYSKYSPGCATELRDKAYVEKLKNLPVHMTSLFADLGERKPVPAIPFISQTCAADVYKMFPGGIDTVDSGSHMLELCRALALGVPGKTTTATGTMDPGVFKVDAQQDPHEISKPCLDIATFICLATLYTARATTGEQLRECEPRNLHILNILERMRKLSLADREQDESKTMWRLRQLIDDAHAATTFMYMDTGAAIHRLDYDIVTVGKPDDRKTLSAHVDKTYLRPLVTMPDASPLVRLWVAVGGDFVLYAALVRAMERDVWRSRDEGSAVATNHPMATQCSCETPTTCIHHVVFEWCRFTTNIHIPGKVATTMSGIASATDGIKKRRGRKRTAAGDAKDPEKVTHDSMFTGTLRCSLASDIMCSPVGNSTLEEQGATPPAMYQSEQGPDRKEQKEKYRPVSAIINSIVKNASIGAEEENAALYERGMAAGATARRTTMAGMGQEKLHAMMFGTSPHVAFENGKARWSPGTRKPIYGTTADGRWCVALRAEVFAVAKGAMEPWLDRVTQIISTARKECNDIKEGSTRPLAVQPMWKNMLRCDPNIDQYDGINAPLMVATMINILRPVVCALMATGIHFPQNGFSKDFPYYDRTKMHDVYGDGGSVNYCMDGKFPAQSSLVEVLVHSTTNTTVREPCKWAGKVNERMTISAVRMKGICKGKDVDYSKKQPTTNQPPSGSSIGETALPHQQLRTGDNYNTNTDEGSDAKRLMRILSAPFVFETDETDDTAYACAFQELESVVPTTERFATSIWMEGRVIGTLLDILENGSDMNIMQRHAHAALLCSPKWRYVCKLLDVMHSMYAPSGMFIPGNDQGLSIFKYMLAYMPVCCAFNAKTRHSKPTYTMCGFVGPCMKRYGRRTNCVLIYDVMFAQDAPYVNTAIDCKLYRSSISQKIFGGAYMTKSTVGQSGILRVAPPPVMSDKFTAPHFILFTPCVPFPDIDNEDKKVKMLGLMSFEEIVTHMESEKMANIISVAAGYDNICAAANEELSQLADRLSDVLSVSGNEANTTARLLKSMAAVSLEERTTDDGIEMTWDDVELTIEGTRDDSIGISTMDRPVDEVVDMYD